MTMRSMSLRTIQVTIKPDMSQEVVSWKNE